MILENECRVRPD